MKGGNWVDGTVGNLDFLAGVAAEGDFGADWQPHWHGVRHCVADIRTRKE